MWHTYLIWFEGARAIIGYRNRFLYGASTGYDGLPFGFKPLDFWSGMIWQITL